MSREISDSYKKADASVRTALNNAWNHWFTGGRHEIPHFSFRDWCRKDYGFTYRLGRTGDEAEYAVNDEKKFLFFVLKWG